MKMDNIYETKNLINNYENKKGIRTINYNARRKSSV